VEIPFEEFKSIFPDPEDSEGYIYIMRSEANIKNLYKIGRSKDVIRRQKELSSPSGVPIEFKISHKRKVINAAEAEKIIHRRLKKYRFTKNREFFEIELKLAIREIDNYTIEELTSTLIKTREQNFNYKEIIATRKLEFENKKPVIGIEEIFFKAKSVANTELRKWESENGNDSDLNNGWGNLIIGGDTELGFWLLRQNGIVMRMSEEKQTIEFTNNQLIDCPTEIFLPIPHKKYEGKCLYAESFAGLFREYRIRIQYKIVEITAE
jgi:hypothetical protein